MRTYPEKLTQLRDSGISPDKPSKKLAALSRLSQIQQITANKLSHATEPAKSKRVRQLMLHTRQAYAASLGSSKLNYAQRAFVRPENYIEVLK